MIKMLIGDVDILIKENVESSNTLDIDLIIKSFLGFEHFSLRKSCKWYVFIFWVIQKSTLLMLHSKPIKVTYHVVYERKMKISFATW